VNVDNPDTDSDADNETDNPTGEAPAGSQRFHGFWVHPVASWFPLLADEDLQKLADDISEHGQREPVVLLRGDLVDGRNRVAACALAGFEPRVRPWDPEVDGDETGLVSWILSRNLHRRHLDTHQRGMIAARLANLPAHVGKARSSGGQLAATPTQAEAAELLNVGERTVRRARTVLEHGSAELVQAVEQGEVAVSAAAEFVRAVPDRIEQAVVVREGPEAVARAVAEGRPKREGIYPPRLLEQPNVPALDQCGAIYPGGTDRCTERKGHAWSHAFYVDEKRVAWHNTGPEPVRTPAAPVLEPDLAGRAARLEEEEDDSEEQHSLVVVEPGGALEASDAPLPNDERAPFDAYWTPDRVTLACVRWLLEHVDLPEDFTAIESAVGGGGWVRAFRKLAPRAVVDRMDLDPKAPGLAGARRGIEQSWGGRSWLDPLPDHKYTKRLEWDLCAGNRPYNLPLAPWLDLSLERARVVAYLERMTILGDNIDQGRLDWFLAHRPAWIAGVEPRPKWEGPGARPQADQVGSVLLVWIRGVNDTRWDWVDHRVIG
jgi:ParB-like chromosome segregation protein Spo0J